MKIFFLGLISLLVFCRTIAAQKNAPKGFAIYLPPAGTKTRALKNLDLKRLKPVGAPVITESDICWYL